MAFSQNLLGLQTPYPVVTSNYVPGLRLEFARFYGKTGHFINLIFLKKFRILGSFFVSGMARFTVQKGLVLLLRI